MLTTGQVIGVMVLTVIILLLLTILVIYKVSNYIKPTYVSNVPLPDEWCHGGYYCNNTPVPQSEAGVGSVVCGQDKKQWKCIIGSDNRVKWDQLGINCVPGMKNGCQT